MTGRTILLTSAAVIALVAAGCSSGPTTTGTPSAAPTKNSSPASSGSATSSLPYAGAPKVPNPLPASIVNGDPCKDFLTPAQVEVTLGTPTDIKRADEPSIGPGCDLANTQTGAHIVVAYSTALPGGLSAIYQNIKPKASPWKEYPSIQGFPAVGYVTPSGGLPDRFCQVSTGITDNLTVELSLFVGSGKRGKVVPCDAAEAVANQIMATLSQKAGS